MVRSFTKMLQDYQAQALDGASIDQVAARLIAEQSEYMQACNVLGQVYGVTFDEASQYVKTLRKYEVLYKAPELVARFMDDYQGLSEEEKATEPTIARLHEWGLIVGDAVKILCILYHIHLGEARNLLFDHPAWQKEAEFSDRMLALMFSQDISSEEDD